MEKIYEKTCMKCGRRFKSSLARGRFCGASCRNIYRHQHNTWPNRHQSTSRNEDKTLWNDGTTCAIDKEE